jgi:ketosteroid isomerase-like protein
MLAQRHRVVSVAAITVGLAVGLGESRMRGQDALKAEVRAALDEYVRAFSAHDPKAIASRVVAAPSLLVGNDGVVAYGSEADVKGRYTATLDQLAKQKYERSVVKRATVCVMSDNAAVVSAHFVRYRTDGSTLSEPTASYVFAKSAGQWKIVAQINHAPGRGLSCES